MAIATFQHFVMLNLFQHPSGGMHCARRS